MLELQGLIMEDVVLPGNIEDNRLKEEGETDPLVIPAHLYDSCANSSLLYGSGSLGLKIVGRCLTCGRPARRPPPRVSRWGEARPFPPDQGGCDQDGEQVDQVDCDQEAKLTKLTKLTRWVVINVLTKLTVIKAEDK